MDDIGGIEKFFTVLVIDRMFAAEGRGIAARNGLTDPRRGEHELNGGVFPAINGFDHAYTSAIVSLAWGRDAAERFGEYKEGDDTSGDSVKDSFNNELGRQIGEWVAENFPSDVASQKRAVARAQLMLTRWASYRFLMTKLVVLIKPIGNPRSMQQN